MSNRLVRFSSTVFLSALSLLAQPGHAQPNAAHIVPGDVPLELPSPIHSSLGFDTLTLETFLCLKDEDVQGGAGEVGLSIANDGTSGPFIIPILDVLFGEQEDTAHVSVSRLQWIGLEPFSSRCGRWSYSVTLDPDVLQPVSDLTLGRTGGAEPTAPFAGTIEASALLRFSLNDGQRRQTRELPVLLRLDLAGHWTVAESSESSQEDSYSNLVLFVEQAAATLLDPS